MAWLNLQQLLLLNFEDVYVYSSNLKCYVSLMRFSVADYSIVLLVVGKEIDWPTVITKR